MNNYENTFSLEELKEMELFRCCENYIDGIVLKDDNPYKWDYLNDLYHEGMLDFEE